MSSFGHELHGKVRFSKLDLAGRTRLLMEFHDLTTEWEKDQLQAQQVQEAAEALALFHKDPDTKAILYLGEIGGSEETFVAEYAASSGAKPVAALIVGKTAPPGKKMGHAAALIGSKAEGHAAKQKMLRDAGVFVADGLGQVVDAMRAAMARA
mgnify:CR=1 FL=1